MLIEVEEKTKIEIEVSIPSYWKYGSSIIKLLNKGHGIVVSNYSFNYGVEYCENLAAAIETFVTKGEQVTELEFRFAYQTAIDRLRKSFIPVTEKEIV